MKRFCVILCGMGTLLVLAGFFLPLLDFNPISLEKIVTSDGAFDPLALYAFQGMQFGLILAGIPLIGLGIIFLLAEKGIIKIFQWNDWRFLLTILGIQAILGLVYVLSNSYVPSGDSEWYLRQASNLAEGRGVTTRFGEPTAFWPIGYPLLLTPLFKLFGSYSRVAHIFNVVMLSGITLFTYLIASKLFSLKTAHRAALVMAFLPSQTFYALLPVSDTPFSLLVLVLIYLTLQKSSLKNTLFSGVIYGTAMLIRPVVVFYPAILLLYRALQAKTLRPALKHAILVIIIGEVILLPWQIRNYSTFKDFVFVSNNGGYNMWMGNNDHASGGVVSEPVYVPKDTLHWMQYSLNEKERDVYRTTQAISFMLDNPLKTLKLWGKKLVHLFIKDSKCITEAGEGSYQSLSPTLLMSLIAVTEGYYYALGIAFLLALVPFAKRERFSARNGLIIGTIAYFILIYMPFIAEGRFHMPLIPLFAMVVCSNSLLTRTPITSAESQSF